MDRFFQLQEKMGTGRGSFMRLNGPERKEYKELKKQYDEYKGTQNSIPALEQVAQVSVIPTDVSKNQEVMVERLTKSLEEANQRISLLELQKSNKITEEDRSGWYEKKQKPKVRTASLITWRESEDLDPMIVIGRTRINRYFDKDSNQYVDLYRFTFLTKENEKVTKDLPLLTIARCKTSVQISLEKEYEKTLRKFVGKTVDRRKHNYDSYKDEPLGQVDMFEERVEREFDAMLPDGRMIHVPEFILNGS